MGGTAPLSPGQSPYVKYVSTSPKQLAADTTYRELLGGAEKLKSPPGMFIAGTIRPGGSNNDSPFYQSEYSSKAGESQLKNAHAGSLYSVKPQKRDDLGVGVSEDVAPAVSVDLKHEPINSSYRTCYGSLGENPRAKAAPTPRDTNFTSSTRELL